MKQPKFPVASTAYIANPLLGNLFPPREKVTVTGFDEMLHEYRVHNRYGHYRWVNEGDLSKIPFKKGDRVRVLTRGGAWCHCLPVGSVAEVVGEHVDAGGVYGCRVETVDAFQQVPIDELELVEDKPVDVAKPAARLSFTEYVDSVLRHAFYPGAGTTAGLTYAALGLAGEAGETANKVKKILRDAGGVISEERLQQIKDELGDVLWYVAACARELDVTLEDVARHNVEKLAARHGEKKDNVRHIRFPPHA